MADGTSKPIEKIRKGDWVLSRDAKTGKTSAKKVVQTFEHQSPATLVLHFKGGERIETTEGHPFYVRGKGFVKAGELGIGNSIVTRAGPSAELLKVERKDAPVTVYNFEVEDFHTYFVGSGLWVHNDCVWINHVFQGNAFDLELRETALELAGTSDAQDDFTDWMEGNFNTDFSYAVGKQPVVRGDFALMIRLNDDLLRRLSSQSSEIGFGSYGVIDADNIGTLLRNSDEAEIVDFDSNMRSISSRTIFD